MPDPVAPVFPVGNLRHDVARDDAHLVALHEDIDAKATKTGQGDCQVHFQLLGKIRLLRGVHQLLGYRADFAGLQRFPRDRAKLALELGTGRCAGTQVEVRTLFFRQYLQPFRNTHATPPPEYRRATGKQTACNSALRSGTVPL